MPAQCHDAAAGPADVPQEELEQGAAADHLRAISMLGPAHRIAPSGGALTPGIGENRLGHLDEGLLRAAGDLLDHLWCVAAEVPLDDLEHGLWVLQRLVTLGWGFAERPDQVVKRRPRWVYLALRFDAGWLLRPG